MYSYLTGIFIVYKNIYILLTLEATSHLSSIMCPTMRINCMTAFSSKCDAFILVVTPEASFRNASNSTLVVISHAGRERCGRCCCRACQAL